MRIAPYLAALAIVVPSAVVQGLWSGRWTAPEAFDARLEAIRRIPLELGDWTGRDVAPEARAYERAGVAGGVMRRYQRRDGAAISLLLVCGRPGPVSVHAPETCYVEAGYAALGRRARVGVPGLADEFWASDFIKTGEVSPETLRIFHAWSASGPWKAPSDPRLDFAGSKALYKIYVVRPMTRTDEPLSDDPGVDFLRQSSRAIRRAVGPGA